MGNGNDAAKENTEMRKKTSEYLTGISIGLLIGILFFMKLAFAAPVDDAEAYLNDNGIEITEEVSFWAEYYGNKYDICPETIEAICWVESRCIPSVQSKDKACKGLMQIKPSCHKERMIRLNARNVFDPANNIKIGTDYLAELLQDEDLATALTIYNGQSQKKIEAARRGEYSKYVSNILKISEALERSHDK